MPDIILVFYFFKNSQEFWLYLYKEQEENYARLKLSKYLKMQLGHPLIFENRSSTKL